MANSLSVTPEYGLEGPTNLSTTVLSLDSTVEGLKASGSPSAWRPHSGFLDSICPADSLALDIPQPPTREQNIEELEFMLRDNGLEEAANSESMPESLEL